jgi:hypothetical protein
MRKSKLVLLIIILAKFSLENFAQEIPEHFGYLKGQFHYGYIMQHRNSIGHLIEGRIKGFELNWAVQTKGDKVWHYENNFPEAGFAMHVYSLANTQQLGQLFALAPYYDIGLNEKNKTSRLHLRLSCGVSYSTKTFDPILNHKNNVVSTSLNAFVNFKWYYKFQISKNLRLDAGLNFVHASNGRFKTPNLGINMMTIHSGLTYCFNQKNGKTIQQIDSSYLNKSKHELFGIFSFGINETEPPGGPKFLAQSYTFGYYFKKRNTHKFGGGIDAFYCQSNQQEIYDTDSIRFNNNLNYLQVGARFSYSYVIGNLSLPIEFGHYLYTKHKGNGLFYHRIGFRYQFKNRIIATFALKTHWAVAHYFEYGIGYRFR